MPTVRLKVPELFREYRVTAYQLAKASRGRIDESTLYRLARKKGRLDFIATDLLDALCDVLEEISRERGEIVKVEPGELLEREPARTKRKRARRKL
jgi:DNA-binding Xre family transcriptional regulator